LTRLEKLYLTSNELNKLDAYLFRGLAVSLNILDLSFNRICLINEYCFKYLLNLKYLNLYSNSSQLSFIDLNSSIKHLKFLNKIFKMFD
jgi:Leucine-rich repeat (LRR) protein